MTQVEINGVSEGSDEGERGSDGDCGGCGVWE